MYYYFSNEKQYTFIDSINQIVEILNDRFRSQN